MLRNLREASMFIFERHAHQFQRRFTDIICNLRLKLEHRKNKELLHSHHSSLYTRTYQEASKLPHQQLQQTEANRRDLELQENREREPADVDFCSITIDGGSDNDIMKQRLSDLTKQREQLQQMEIELRAQVMTREHANANVKLKEQLHGKEQMIRELWRKMKGKERELHALRLELDNQKAWTKDDIIMEQSKELQSYRIERVNTEAERVQHIKQIHDFQEHIQEKDCLFMELQKQDVKAIARDAYVEVVSTGTNEKSTIITRINRRCRRSILPSGKRWMSTSLPEPQPQPQIKAYGWEMPPEGMLKFNVDACHIRNPMRLASTSGILRNYKGKIERILMRRIKPVELHPIAEFWGLYFAIESCVAENLPLDKVIFEVDCKETWHTIEKKNLTKALQEAETELEVLKAERDKDIDWEKKYSGKKISILEEKIEVFKKILTLVPDGKVIINHVNRVANLLADQAADEALLLAMDEPVNSTSEECLKASSIQTAVEDMNGVKRVPQPKTHNVPYDPNNHSGD